MRLRYITLALLLSVLFSQFQFVYAQQKDIPCKDGAFIAEVSADLKDAGNFVTATGATIQASADDLHTVQSSISETLFKLIKIKQKYEDREGLSEGCMAVKPYIIGTFSNMVDMVAGSLALSTDFNSLNYQQFIKDQPVRLQKIMDRTLVEMGAKQDNSAVEATQTPIVVVVTSAPSGAILIVSAPNLNIRTGPSTDYEITSALKTGDTATVIGKNSSGTWWKIEKGQLQGWVIADSQYSTVQGDTSAIGVVAAPPQPTVSSQLDQTINVSSSTGGEVQPSTSFTCPSNCDGAVAMGLSAQQAAQCPGLDRDHDGVACYGD